MKGRRRSDANGGAAVPAGDRARRWAATVLVLAISSSFGCGGAGGSTDSAVAGLEAAIGEVRRVEPRLSAFDDWAPCHQPTTELRCPAAGPIGPEAMAQVARLMLAAERDPSPVRLQAAALALLVTGLTDDVRSPQRLLERAALLAPLDAAIANDLAAARYLSWRATGRTSEGVAALEAATLAAELDPRSPRASFNEGLLLAALGLGEGAARAFDRHRGIEPGSSWSEEAMRRSGELSAGESVVGSDRARQQVEEALGEWARAVGRGDGSAARRAIDRARAGAVALEASDAGGGELAEVEAILASESGGGDRSVVLAEAHRVYADAVAAYARQDLATAGRGFREAERAFGALGAPRRWWASLHLAIADFHRHEPAAADRRLRAILEAVGPDRHPHLRGRALWMRALISFVDGHYAAALELYRAALGEAVRAQATQDEIALRTRIAQCLFLLGSTEEGWSEAVRASQLVHGEISSRVRVTLYAELARAASDSAFHRAALRFHDAAVDAASEGEPAIEHAVALWFRSDTLVRLGREAEAQEDLDLALQAAERIPDPTLRDDVIADVSVARAGLLLDRQPDRARALLAEVLPRFEAAGRRLRLATVHHRLALAALAAGGRDEARAALAAAIAEIERERGAIADPRLRVSYFARPQEVFELALRLEAEAGADGDELLALAERRRARGLLDRLGFAAVDGGGARPAGARDIAAALAPTTALLEVEVLADRVLLLVVDPAGVTLEQVVVPRARVERLVARIESVMEHSDEWRPAARELGRLLLAPLAARLADVTTLVLAPDELLEPVPFPLLGADDDPLFARFDLVVVPSASVFLRVGSRRSEEWTAASVAAMGDPAFAPELAPGLGRLPAAVGETAEIVRLYPRSMHVIGEQATEESFWRGAGEADVLHFAGHALAAPGAVSLLLAPSTDRDGLLEGHEISERQLGRVRVVVLSACEGAGGETIAGEGRMSLAARFLEAGATAVVASLWPVEDEAAARLAVGFHRRLTAGHAPAEALRLAQLAAREEGMEPAAWAGFRVVGVH